MKELDRFAPCPGSYGPVSRTDPTTGSAECPQCGGRFDRARLAGETKQYMPLHSPCQLAYIAAQEARRGTK